MDMHKGVAGFDLLPLFYIELHHASGKLAGYAHGSGLGLSLYQVGFRLQKQEADERQQRHGQNNYNERS